jgi:phosphoenolpyruvate-protein phosphotransferase/dihydroxyacetone kinase phosphotransfer subunit
MTVGLVIVSHSAQLARGVVELAGQMAQGKVKIAAAGGAIDGSLGTSADAILAAIQAVDGPDGVLVLLDLGGALLSSEMALEMLDEQQRARTRISFAPLVEGAVAAAVEAALGRSLIEVQQAAEKTASTVHLQQLKPVEQPAGEPTPSEPERVPATAAPTPAPGSGRLEARLVLTNPTGLHARPASLFVQTAAKFHAAIQAQVEGRERQANAASIMEVLSLGARQGDTLVLRASGDDARAALAALSELVQADFYEAAPPAAPPAPPSPAAPALTEQLAAPAAPTPPSAPAESGMAQESWPGVTTSPGVAIGPALLYSTGVPSLRALGRRSIAPEQVPAEQERMRQALADAAQELQHFAAGLQSQIGREQAAIFEAQATMLGDPTLLRAAQRLVEEQRIDAASALAEVGEQQAAALEALGNALLAARAVDVRDAIGRAIRILRGAAGQPPAMPELDHAVILLAQELTPSDTAQLRLANVLAIGTVQGGPTSHSAILARALGIPAMAGLDEAALRIIRTGDVVGLDAGSAGQGWLYRQPSPQMRERLTRRIEEQQRERVTRMAAARQGHAPLMIGTRRILTLANIGGEAEAEAARQWGAEGVGLLRTEFLFASATTLPGEEEQRQRYVKVFRAFTGDRPSHDAGPFVVRTLDAGADKPMPSLQEVLGTMAEANPALGVRGVRIHLAHQDLLEQQLAALLLAAAETGIELHIMFPMITTVEELRTARAVFDRVYARLQAQGQRLPAHVPVGIMVEVPAAAIMAPELAELADFFSIGSNDLSQYTLAVDRTNPALADLYHPMQPSVLRLIAQVAQAGRRAGKPVAVCGEAAGDVRLAPLLVALGVDELSMTPTSLVGVRSELARWSPERLDALAARFMHAKTVAEVEDIIGHP